MRGRKHTDEKVAAYYLALTDDERKVLDERMAAAGRKLEDMRLSKSTGKLDERLLVPVATYKEMAGRLRSRLRNADGTVVKDGQTPDDFTRKGVPKAAGLASRRYMKRLQKGETLQSFIVNELSDGLELAHFYIDIIRMKPEDCRKSGIYMNHKLAAATWLGERGWGKPKGDDEKSSSININLVNHANAETLPPPVRVTVTEADTSIASADSDAGKDEPRLVDLTGTLVSGSRESIDSYDPLTNGEQRHPMSDIKVDVDFDLEEVR